MAALRTDPTQRLAKATYKVTSGIYSPGVPIATTLGAKAAMSPATIGACTNGAAAGWVGRQQNALNAYDNLLFDINLHTDFCRHNGGGYCHCVAYAHSYRTYGITSLGQISWVFAGWTDPIDEGYYSYNGYGEGAVRTAIEGTFDECLAHGIGCFDTIAVQDRTYVHYIGSVLTWGYTEG